MKTALLIIEMIVSFILVALILVQNKDGGLSAGMGGSGESFESTKRGPEKVIYNATILLAFIFVVNALVIAII